MTFRPTDDILEQMADSQTSQEWISQNSGYDGNVSNNNWDYFEWLQEPSQLQNFGNDLSGQLWELDKSSSIDDIPVEEVKAPDLSEILKQQEENDGYLSSDEIGDVDWNDNVLLESMNENGESNSNDSQNVEVTSEIGDNNEKKDYNIEIEKDKENIENQTVSESMQEESKSLLDGSSTNSRLDFLIDEQRHSSVKKYKMIHRILFRWWVFVLVAIVGFSLWAFLYAKFNQFQVAGVIKEDSIQDKEKWIENTTDKILSDYVGSGWNFEVLVPFGEARTDWNSVQSKSNLISYKGVILPQLIVLDKNIDDFISLDKFNEGEVSRKDLENLLKYTVMDGTIWAKTKDLPSVSELLWVWNKFQEKTLIDSFSLWCVEWNKISDSLCNSFIWTFYKYGKYYDLSYYDSDVLLLMRELNNQGKDEEPLCRMILDYIEHSWKVTSDSLGYAMEYCSIEEYNYYRKLVNFIKVDNSLWQPEVLGDIFEDSDLNAYKLLSIQQILNRKLTLKTVSEDYINSYLNYVQTLINKDKGTGRYLDAIYKDTLYVFNMDVLYPYLIENSLVNLRLQVDQINNGNVVYGYPSLLSQLTTPDIIKSNTDSSEIELENLKMEDIFEQYYYMTDRLKIRRVTKLSDDELKVQTELFTNKILSVTNGVTLKLTVSLYRNGNVLYVSNIKVANQIKFSDVLNIYAKDGVTFYAMLNYIDEQIGMWYELPSEEWDQKQTFCEELQERDDIVVYSCDDASILLYKGDIEYNFVLVNWILDSFTIWDEELNSLLQDHLKSVMFMRENTSTVIKSIIEFEMDEWEDDTISEKLDIIDQFRIHFKIVPDDISKIEWTASEFLVNFMLWEFNLQANYDIEKHLLTKISYVACDKVLEIRNLTIEVSTENESKLIEILNNPRIFLAQSNPSAYKKYQRMCD